MQKLVFALIVAAVVLTPVAADAACGKRVRGAARKVGAVARFVLPPYGR